MDGCEPESVLVAANQADPALLRSAYHRAIQVRMPYIHVLLGFDHALPTCSCPLSLAITRMLVLMHTCTLAHLLTCSPLPSSSHSFIYARTLAHMRAHTRTHTHTLSLWNFLELSGTLSNAGTILLSNSRFSCSITCANSHSHPHVHSRTFVCSHA
jgi:hypothetical protein